MEVKQIPLGKKCTILFEESYFSVFLVNLFLYLSHLSLKEPVGLEFRMKMDFEIPRPIKSFYRRGAQGQGSLRNWLVAPGRLESRCLTSLDPLWPNPYRSWNSLLQLYLLQDWAILYSFLKHWVFLMCQRVFTIMSLEVLAFCLIRKLWID